MTGLKDLFASERGVLAIYLVLVCTLLLLIGRMTIDQWIDYTKWIGLTLIASKTVTTAIDSLIAKKAAQPTPQALG